MLVVGGGDLIRDDKGWKTFWYTTEKIFLALLFQRKVCLLNVGIGKPKSRVSTYALKYALRKAEKIIVRDRRSLAVCKDLNAGDKAVLAHDIVLDIHAFHEVKFRNPQKTVTGEESREYCVFCLRHNPDTYSGFQLDERKLACISDMLDIVIQYHNVRVMCVPFQGGKNNDNDLHGKVLKNMQHQEHAEILDWNGNISEILSYFKNAKFVIAMRLHAVVLAVLYDKPCIVFPYDIKVNEFCAQFNIKSIIQSDDLLNSTKVQQMLTEVMNAPSVSYDKSSSWCSIGLDV
jgi:polysaccharide pyruvyl transferase WcaK-like protein